MPPPSRHSWRPGLAARLAVATVASLLLALLGAAYQVARLTANTVRADLAATLDHDLDALAAAAVPPLVADRDALDPNLGRLRTLLDRFHSGEAVTVISFRDTAGALIFNRDETIPLRAPLWFGRWCGLDERSGNRPVAAGGDYFGVITLALSPVPAVNRAWTHYLAQVNILVPAFALTLGCIWLFLYLGLKPLQALAAASDALGQGDRSVRVVARGSPELQSAIDGFNRMASRIQAAHDALSASERRWRILVEAAPDAIVVYDFHTGEIVEANGSAERLFGRERDELIRGGVRRLYPPAGPGGSEGGGGLAAHAERALSGEQILFEQEVAGAGGRRPLCEVRLALLQSDTRTLLRASFLDITERRRAEELIRELNVGLEQRVAERTADLTAANRELDAFAYSVSHDLRAPLRGINGFGQALREDCQGVLGATGRGYLERIINASTRMDALLGGLLALSRSTRGELHREQIDLSALAARIREDLERSEPDRQVRCELEAGLWAYGDGPMLEIVMRNLLSNAWKYTARAATPLVRFYREDRDGRCLYCVADNGAGFDMQHAGQLFKPFHRLHHEEDFAGIGIGLATVQRIIDRHGGTIEVEARLGEGAVFRFDLPS